MQFSRRNKWNHWVVAATIGVLSPQMIVHADEQSDGPKFVEVKPGDGDASNTLRVRVVAGKHWLGIHAQPIDEALRAQLGLKDRLIVHHVFPGGPAAKAGLQTHDILLKYGDKEITSLNDLIQTVEDRGEKSTQLKVLRGGKEITLSVDPSERPAEEQLHKLIPGVMPDDVKKLLLKQKDGLWEINPKELTWKIIGPGVLDSKSFLQSKTEFPEGVSISVTKEKDQPAKVVVKRDGKTYEATQDQLDSLPKDLREPVERMLGGVRGAITIKGGHAKLKEETEVQMKDAKEVLIKAIKGQKDLAEKAVKESLKSEEGALHELRKAVEQLTKEIQQLRESKPAPERK